MIFIRIKGHFDDKIFLTKFKDISQNSRTFHGFQGHCGNPDLYSQFQSAILLKYKYNISFI